MNPVSGLPVSGTGKAGRVCVHWILNFWGGSIKCPLEAYWTRSLWSAAEEGPCSISTQQDIHSRVGLRSPQGAPMPTYIHHVAVDSKNYKLFFRVLEEYIREHPDVIISHAVGFLGHNYLVRATEDISDVFRDAGIVCSVNEF